jgi:hypothetical protein
MQRSRNLWVPFSRQFVRSRWAAIIEQDDPIRAPFRDDNADLSAAHLPSAGPALACNVRSTNMQLPSQSLRTGNKQVQVRKTTR